MSDKFRNLVDKLGAVFSQRLVDNGDETFAPLYMNKEVSLTLGTPGGSQSVAVSTTSAKSTAIATGVAVVTLSVECFVRYGSNPTALSNGTDQILLAGVQYRLSFPPGSELAFKTATGTGTVYITPGA